LPGPRQNLGATVSGSLIYVAGGWDGSGPRREVYVTTVQPDGSLSDWRVVSPLPVPLFGTTLSASGGYLYIVGGHDGSAARREVYRASITAANGDLGDWRVLTSNSLPSPLERHAAVVYRGHLVVLGGRDGSGNSSKGVYAATLSADGSLGAWQTGFLPTLPQALDRHAAVVANIPGCGEVIYVVGGRNGGAYQSTVYHTNCYGSTTDRQVAVLVVKSAPLVNALYGRITDGTAVAPGILLDLDLYDGSNWTSIRQTSTDADGNYQFLDPPPLVAGQQYRVIYRNHEGAGSRLAYRGSFVISSYGGGSVHGGSFDIKNIYHLSPSRGAIVTLPATFCWSSRNVPGDSYYFVLQQASGATPWEFLTSGANTCYTLNSLPTGFQFGIEYSWSIAVANNQVDGYDYGLSHYYQEVTFQAGAGAIYGWVTYQGLAAPGIALDLRFYNGTAWSTAATASTDATGKYLFEGIPALSAGQKYYVRYGPNTSNSSYLYAWYGPDIVSYPGGSLVAGGDFDIANVALLSPAAGATVSFPATFTWQRRQLGGEGYRWLLFDPASSDGWTSGDLGDVGEYTLNGLPQGAVTGKVYGWYVEVYASPDSYGTSYFYREVTFSPVAATKPEGNLPDQVGTEREERPGSVPVRESPSE
jgi:hypothetical protein